MAQTQKQEKSTVRKTRGTRTNRVRRTETKVDVVVTESVSETPVVTEKKEIRTPFDFWMGIYSSAFSNYVDLMTPTRVLEGLRVLGDDYSGYEDEDKKRK